MKWIRYQVAVIFVMALAVMPYPGFAQISALCAFDSLQFGKLEEARQTANGYEITLDMEIETITHEIPKSASFYLAVEAFLAKAKQSDTPLEAAFLYEGDTLCGFTQASYDQIYVSSYTKRNGNYAVSVSTNETDNEYTLKVSPSNGLHGNADNLLKTLLQKIAYVYFTPEGEILDIGLYQ